MHKLFTVCTAAILAFALSSCGIFGKNDEQPPAPVPPAAATTQQPAPVGDWQYAVAANVQLQAMRQELVEKVAGNCGAGFAKATTDIQFAFAAIGQMACMNSLGVQSAAPMAINAPQPTAGAWERSLQVVDRVIGIFGLKYAYDAQNHASDNNAKVSVAAFGGMASMGGSIKDTALGGFAAIGQFANTTPVNTNTYNIGGPANIGSGTLTYQQWQNSFNKNCPNSPAYSLTTGAPPINAPFNC